jgi:hypothetical protein
MTLIPGDDGPRMACRVPSLSTIAPPKRLVARRVWFDCGVSGPDGPEWDFSRTSFRGKWPSPIDQAVTGKKLFEEAIFLMGKRKARDGASQKD